MVGGTEGSVRVVVVGMLEGGEVVVGMLEGVKNLDQPAVPLLHGRFPIYSYS